MLFSNQIYFKYNYTTRVIFGIIKFLLQSYKIKRKVKSQRQIQHYRLSGWESEYTKSHWAENASFLVHLDFPRSSEYTGLNTMVDTRDIVVSTSSWVAIILLITTKKDQLT